MKPRGHNYAGERYGRLMVIGPSNHNLLMLLATPHLKLPLPTGTFWVCRYVCGSLVAVRAAQLTQRRKKSCGCLKMELDAKRTARKK